MRLNFPFFSAMLSCMDFGMCRPQPRPMKLRWHVAAVSRQILLAVALCLASLGATAQPLQVVYPDLNGNGAHNFGYRALELALQKSGQPYQLSVLSGAVNDERARAQLQQGEISIADFGAGAEFESNFSAIYFPIDRGLLGFRLFLIRQPRVAEFAKINNLQDLRGFSAGQGLGWSNITIMQRAGLKVETGPTLENLFPMLERARFDFLPLGLNEVYGFRAQYLSAAPSMVVDERIVLIYKFARLFYVRPDNKTLHAVVLRGLQKAFQDGSFQTLFDKDPAVKEAMQAARLSTRIAIRIDNPLMTPQFREMSEAYFYPITNAK